MKSTPVNQVKITEAASTSTPNTEGYYEVPRAMIKVLNSPPMYPGYGIENSLDDNPNDDYSAALEAPLPQSFTLALSKPVKISAITLIWESSINYGVNYIIHSIAADGSEQLLASEENQRDQQQLVKLQTPIQVQKLRLTLTRTSGQPRLLLRQITLLTHEYIQPTTGDLMGIQTPAPVVEADLAHMKILAIYPSLPTPPNPTGECIEGFIPSFDYKAYLQQTMYILDPYGVLQTDYGFGFSHAGIQYNPWSIGAYGSMGLYAWCTSKDEVGLKVAYQQANWLAENLSSDGVLGNWVYHFPNVGYFAPAGWVSALGDAYAMSFLTQMYKTTNDPKYLHVVEKVVKSYETDVKKGGVQSQVNGEIFFEEVAHPDAPPAHILNAHILALQALDYVAHHLHNEEAGKLVKLGLLTFRDTLGKFDAGVTTIYAFTSIEGIPSSSRLHYAHYTHIDGAYWAYTQTGDPAFLDYTFRWIKYTQPYLPFDESIGCIDCPIVPPDPEQRQYIVPTNEKEIFFDLKSVQKVRSFGYNALGVYPVSFTVSFSLDGKDWSTKIDIDQYQKSDGIFLANETAARYVKLNIRKLSDEYAGKIRFGVFRIDTNDYWEKPLVFMSDENNHVLNDYPTTVSYLTDDNPATGLTGKKKTIIYADLRKPHQLKDIKLNFHVENPSNLSCVLEVSSNLTQWKPMTTDVKIENNGTDMIITVGNDLPFQYFRLTLNGVDTIIVNDVIID